MLVESPRGAPTGAGVLHRYPSAYSYVHTHHAPSPAAAAPYALALLPPAPPPPPWKPSPYTTVASSPSYASQGMLMRHQREWARRQWRAGPMPPGPLPPAPSLPPSSALALEAAAAAMDPVAAGETVGAAPESLVPFSPRSFYRNNAFTASFTALYHDTTLEGVAVHAGRARRHAETQHLKLERRREELLQMQALVIKYRNRAEYLRNRIRADRKRRYACFLAVVRRMQAVFRRRQLLKRRQEEERRQVERAAALLQGWGRRSLAVLRAKQELQRRRHAARCREAGPVVVRALKRWWAIRLAQCEREKLAVRRRHLLNKRRAAGLAVALWCQRHYRGTRARKRIAAWQEERRRKLKALRARKPPGDAKKRPFR